MLRMLAVFCLLLSTVTAVSSYDYSPLQRIARAPHSNAALLVPYPRVGKRSNGGPGAFLGGIHQQRPAAPAGPMGFSPLLNEERFNSGEQDNSAEHRPLNYNRLGKRLFVARVGKRAYMYAARVGK